MGKNGEKCILERVRQFSESRKSGYCLQFTTTLFRSRLCILVKRRRALRQQIPWSPSVALSGSMEIEVCFAAAYLMRNVCRLYLVVVQLHGA